MPLTILNSLFPQKTLALAEPLHTATRTLNHTYLVNHILVAHILLDPARHQPA